MSFFEVASLAAVGVAVIGIALCTPFAIGLMIDWRRDRRDRARQEVDQLAQSGTVDDAPTPYDQDWLHSEKELVDTTSIEVIVVQATEPAKVEESKYAARVELRGRSKSRDVEAPYVAVLIDAGGHRRIVISALPLSWRIGDAVKLVHDTKQYRIGGDFTVESIILDDEVWGAQLDSHSLPVAAVVGFKLN